MTTRVIQDHNEFAIEVEAGELDVEVISGGGKTLSGSSRYTPQEAFNRGMELIKGCAEQVRDTITQVQEEYRPNEFEVQFAVKLDLEVGAFIAKTNTGAQLQVTMKWTQIKS